MQIGLETKASIPASRQTRRRAELRLFQDGAVFPHRRKTYRFHVLTRTELNALVGIGTNTSVVALYESETSGTLERHHSLHPDTMACRSADRKP